MNKQMKFLIIVLFSVFCLCISVGIGSVAISPIDTFKIICYKVFGTQFGVMPTDVAVSILWKIRLPRVLLAFLVGAAISIGGVIMQSVLRNPLASPYTLGVSSGAALGAGVAILFGLNFLGQATLPVFGLTFGLLTVFLAITLASKVDKNFDNSTIILTGFALSLFANAIITLIMSIKDEELKSLIFWQLGSFALKDWSYPTIMLPVVILAIGISIFFSKDMDILTFGEEQAKIAGVDLKKVKWILIGVSAIAAGFSVAFAGIIGFLDLFTPHVARRIFGAVHKYTIIASAFLGGSFMMLCDLIARTILAPMELPVGAVTSLIGAPFFIYIFFSKKRAR